MVSCSHTFVKITLKNNSVHRVNLATMYNADEKYERNKTPDKRRKYVEGERNNTLEKMNTLDIYACCMNKYHLASRLEFETENYYHNFLTMSLLSFSKIT